MNPEYADIDLIERYLDGKLLKEEALAFEERLKQDAFFAQQFEAQKISALVLEDYEFVQLKKQMQMEMPSIPPKKDGGIKNYLLFIGAAFIIGVGGYFIFNTSIKKSDCMDCDKSNVKNSIDELKSNETSVKNNQFSDSSKSKKNIEIELVDEQPMTLVAKTVTSTSNVCVWNFKDSTNEIHSIEKIDSVQRSLNCSELEVIHNIVKEDACERKNNGSIKINVLSYGKSPYKYQLNNKGSFTSSNAFGYLSVGEYYISIKESSGCIVQIKEPIRIEEKKCKEPFNETFSPSQEGTWKLPVDAGESCKIKFQNKAGQLVHEISVLNGMPSEWDGINLKGEETPAGYYYVIVEKSNGIVEYGYLTINR